MPDRDVRALLSEAAANLRAAEKALALALDQIPPGSPNLVSVDAAGRLVVRLPPDSERMGMWVTAWQGDLEDRPGRAPVSSQLLIGADEYVSRELAAGKWTVEVADVPDDQGGPGWGGTVRTWHTIMVPAGKTVTRYRASRDSNLTKYRGLFT